MKKYYLFIALLLSVFAKAQIINIPDAKFKAKLLRANSIYEIASTQPSVYNSVTKTWTSFPTSFTTIDTNGDGEIQVSEASAIKYLDIKLADIENLEGINYFINLQIFLCDGNLLSNLNVNKLTKLLTLSCTFNQLTNLNVSGLTNLTTLICSNNQFSSMNINSLINLENLDCSHNQLTNLNVSIFPKLKSLHCGANSLPQLNVSGLDLEALYCFDNQMSSLNVSELTNLVSLNCDNNQLTSLNVSMLSNLTYLYCSGNQIKSLDVSRLTKLLDFNCYDNQLTSLNVSGLTNLMSLFCFDNQLTSLDVSESTNLTYLVCFSNQLTSLLIKNNNRNWDDLRFQDNPNLAYICVDEKDTAMVQTLINDNGLASTCNLNSYCSFTPGGTFYTINGTNKIDENNNGCDATDLSYPNLKFTITDGINTGSLIANASDFYSIPVQAGMYTITPQLENPSYFDISPASATIDFPVQASPFEQNFCILPNGVHHDLEVVVIPLIFTRPGFDATYKIKYKNKGNFTENTTIELNYNDAVLDYVSSTLAPTIQSADVLSWSIGSLTPFQSGEFVITLNVNSPMETPAINNGDILNYSAIIKGLNIDETPADNTFTLQQMVVGAMDPNDKICLEGNIISPSMIGEYVHYQIRFENTGSYFAQNIVVKDIIDITKFDISTLQITDSSHSCSTKITDNKVEFIFENIKLPHEDASNDGFIVFKIKTLPTLAINSEIENEASIYFDYNFPVVTNTAKSTFKTLAVDSFNFSDYLNISPNPAKDVLKISNKQNITISSIRIYNMLGQLVETVVKPTNLIDVSGLKTGNYIISITSDKGVSSEKLIKN